MSIQYRLLKSLLLVSVFLFSSCEKGLDSIHVESIVYIPNSGLTSQTVLLGESVYKLGVYKSGVNQQTSTVKVNLEVDQEAFAKFLTSNPGYELLPTANYDIEATEVAIGEGQERADLNIRLTNITEAFVNKKYVLPIGIRSVSSDVKINADKKVAFLYFARFRSAYECKYKVFGQVTDQAGNFVKKVDEVLIPSSVAANIIDVTGPETAMKLRLTVQNNKVMIAGAPGSEAFNIQPNPAKGESTYAGAFDVSYQANKGTFKLFYSYVFGGKPYNAAVDLSFTL
uniref:DUF1735 domain-containing protein n=1 Tax=Pedobacter schmidteae TaxID=2201271 RepID=UPI000EAE9D6C|nr:DUF1735 domain-containing protein [Pedobacter schmidteae]